MNPKHDEFDLPTAFTQRLRAAYSHDVEIPAAVEAAVVGVAREKFERRRRVRMMVRWGAAAASALAAAIALAVVLHRPGGTVSVPLAKGDVNGDGLVNMVDAL